MRLFIIVIMMSLFYLNYIESKGIYSYVKYTNKVIYNICNNEAYQQLNNTKLYDCFNKNYTNKCTHLDNFTDYHNITNDCTNNINKIFGIIFFISTIIWILLSRYFY